MKLDNMANRLGKSIDQADGWLRSWRSDARRALAIAVAMLLALLPAFAQTQYLAHPATSPAITAADLSARDKAISDHAFQGHAPAHDLVIIGYGSSQLEDLLATVLRAQNRTLTPDPEPEKGHFYRSDHFSLAKVGVPMLAPSQDYDLLDGGKVAGQAVLDDYRLYRYHQPSNKWSPNWDLSGPISDLDAFYELGKALANSDIWPNWYPGNEFRAICDRSMRER
jgi:Peptidase family M28